jgi:hypothetical protein
MKEGIPPNEFERAPEQRIVDALTGRDLTGEYASEKRREFEAGLRAVFLGIARRAFSREPDIAQTVMKKALACHRRYFQVMKGSTNIRAEDIEDAVAEEVTRQSRFYGALARLAEEFKKADVPFAIISPDTCYRHSYWDTGLVSGCNIRAGGAYLCAFPLVPARTVCYMALVQEPVAAQVIFVSEDCVILMPHSEEFAEDFLKVGKRLFAWRQEVKRDFPEATTAYLGNNFLCVDTGEAFSSQRLKDLKAKYAVSAIVKGGSNFTGCIFTGKEEELPVLLRELFFQWH